MGPAEVGVLAPVSEKSGTVLKLKQKLLKCKSTIQVVTFNVKTLNRIGQLLELTASAIDHNIDIICIQEHIITFSIIKYLKTLSVFFKPNSSFYRDTSFSIRLLASPYNNIHFVT